MMPAASPGHIRAVRPSRGALAAIILLLVPGFASTASALQDDAYFAQDGVTYYLVGVGATTGHATLGDGYDTKPAVPFDGCAIAQLRPGMGHGRISVVGMLANATLRLDVSGFGHGYRDDAMATNITLDPGLDPALASEPKVPVSIAAWGVARATVDGANLTDPIGGGSELHATFWVTQDGYRDDATGRLESTSGALFVPGAEPRIAPGNPEVHLRVRSPPGAGVGTPDVYGWAPPGDLPNGMYSQASDYERRFVIPNTRFGGVATVMLAAQSLAPPGQTDLDLAVFSPGGLEVANLTVSPDTTTSGGDVQTAEFPLDDFGNYVVRVTGKIALGNYQVSATLQPPENGLDLNFWWDAPAFGSRARGAYSQCNAEVPSTYVGQSLPPSYPTGPVVAAAVGVAAGVLIVMKLVSHTRATGAFHRAKR